MTESEFINELKRKGFVRSSKSYTDYSRGKKIIEREANNSQEYEALIKILADYLNF